MDMCSIFFLVIVAFIQQIQIKLITWTQ